MRLSWLRTILFVALLAHCGVGNAATRAVIVGISTYVTPEADTRIVRSRRIRDLPAAAADASIFRQVLLSSYGVLPEQALLLQDAEATRDAILASIERHLLHDAEKGDTAIFYFAGHGSQVENETSSEIDRLDETLVPADSVVGAADIRDKELRLLFNRILDKGVELTVIIDSCHSGSITRGLSQRPPTRYVRAPAAVEIEDEDLPSPASRGALVLSSARDNQLARDGAFTPILRNAMLAGGPAQSASDIYQRLRAMMQGAGYVQEPSLEATPERRNRPLIPGAGKSANDGLRLPVVAVDVDGRSVIVEAGESLGIGVGTTLRPADGAEPVLTIKRHLDLTRSEATLRRGQLVGVNPGDLMTVNYLAAPATSVVPVWLGVPGN